MGADAIDVVPIHLLLVADSADATSTAQALREAHVLHDLHHAATAADALDLLYKRRGHEGAARPDLIFVDFDIGADEGRVLLDEIKSDESLKRIPVVVMGSSKLDEDVAKVYERRANAYVSKPVDVEHFLEVIKAINNFWLSIVKLPPGSPGPAQ